MSEGVESTNAALDTSDADKLLESMAVPELAIHSVIADCKDMYLEKLQEALEAKKSQGNQHRQLDVLINYSWFIWYFQQFSMHLLECNVQKISSNFKERSEGFLYSFSVYVLVFVC